MPKTEAPNERPQQTTPDRSQDYYDDKFNSIVGGGNTYPNVERGLKDAEAHANDQVDANKSDSARDKELAPATPGNWDNKYNKESPSSNSEQTRGQKLVGLAKKRGGIFGLIAALGLGGGLLAGFLGPASMLINIMENVTLTNDTSSTSMQQRFMKVFSNMTNPDNDPICANNTKSLKCRTGRISNKAIADLNRKGIVAYGEGIDTTKRSGYPPRNPTGYRININGVDTEVPARDLTRVLNENPRISRLVLGTGGAFNLKMKAWSSRYLSDKFFNRAGITKNGGIADGKNERLPAGQRYANALNKVIEKVPGLDRLNTAPQRMAERTKANINKAAKGGVGYVVAAGGCIASKIPKYIAGGVAAVELARVLPLANEVILSPGSKLQAAGVDTVATSFTPEDADAVNTLLTEKTPRASDGKLTSALDSPILQSAAGINTGKPAVPDTAPGYGVLRNDTMRSLLDAEKAMTPVCNVILSPAAIYAAMAVDAAVTLALSSTVILGAVKVAASAAVAIAAEQAAGAAIEAAAPAIIESLTDSDVLASAQGEAFGDALGISALAFFSVGGMSRHLTTLKQSQMLAFEGMQKEQEALEREMDIASLSPFDTSSRHTFLGSLLFSARTAASTSGGGFLSSLTSLAKLPAQSLLPSVSANTPSNRCTYAEQFDMTTVVDGVDQTPAINAAGLPCTGLTPEQANISTPGAIERVQQEGWLDEDVNIPDNATIDDLLSQNYIRPDTPLREFIETCSDFESGDHLFNQVGCTVDSASEGLSQSVGFCENPANAGDSFCTTDEEDPTVYGEYNPAQNNESLVAMSPMLLDYQIAQSINGEDEETGAAVAKENNLTERPEGAIDSGKGWALASGVDYSQYPCDPRTEEFRDRFTTVYGATIRLCIIKSPFSSTNSTNGSFSVASVISTNAMNLYEDAIAAGHKIGLADGMRLNFSAGYISQHPSGTAMDIRVQMPSGGVPTICFQGANTVTGWGTKENAERICRDRFGGPQYEAYRWLTENAANYGFYNFDPEPWHWSTNGL